MTSCITQYERQVVLLSHETKTIGKSKAQHQGQHQCMTVSGLGLFLRSPRGELILNWNNNLK